MKAVPATNVNSQVPIMLAGSSLELDASQQIYAKLFKLDYLSAVEAGAPLVQNLVSQNSSILPFPKSNALLITDGLVNLQRIDTLLKDADRAQVVREEIKFIKLDFVQAAEMQERIENLIQGPLKTNLEGNTSVTADERTNQIILITHPGNMAIIMDVIQSVDVDAAARRTRRVCVHARAWRRLWRAVAPRRAPWSKRWSGKEWVARATHRRSRRPPRSGHGCRGQ